MSETSLRSTTARHCKHHGHSQKAEHTAVHAGHAPNAMASADEVKTFSVTLKKRGRRLGLGVRAASSTREGQESQSSQDIFGYLNHIFERYVEM